MARAAHRFTNISFDNQNTSSTPEEPVSNTMTKHLEQPTQKRGNSSQFWRSQSTVSPAPMISLPPLPPSVKGSAAFQHSPRLVSWGGYSRRKGTACRCFFHLYCFSEVVFRARYTLGLVGSFSAWLLSSQTFSLSRHT